MPKLEERRCAVVKKLAEAWGKEEPQIFGIVVDDLDKLNRDELHHVYVETFKAFNAIKEYAECARNLLWATLCIAEGQERAAKHYRELADMHYARLPQGMRFRQDDPRRIKSDEELEEPDEQEDDAGDVRNQG